jgi:predicted nucleic acid-binding protein
MNILADTNLLTRSVQPNSQHFGAATTAILELKRRGGRLCVVPQIVYEFWAVCTRPPGENGLGMTVAAAGVEQSRVLSLFALLEDTPAVFPEWRRLVVAHDVKGKNSHDARIVAAMNVHGVSTLLTFNGTDFRRYPGISVLDPQFIPAPPSP